MGEAVTILSREEAMALPPNQRPLCMRLPEHIFNRIHEDIGEASMGGSPKKVGRIAFELCHFIADELDKAGEKKIVDSKEGE